MTARTTVPNEPPICWAVLVTTLEPVPAERLASIVDDLFLPLVAAYRGTVRSGA
jgi:hypothetical protein